MKNFLVANKQNNHRYKKQSIDILIKAQIENALELGWSEKDIVLISNFDFKFMDVEAVKAPLNEFCLTGSKMFALKWAFENGLISEPIWAHDLDAWQNWTFEWPEFKDVGIARYSNSKYNGGSVFWKPSAKDIVDEIVKIIEKDKLGREEPTLNGVFRSDAYKDRVTVVNNTFNVGCSGFVKRYERSSKPIRCLHFHPYNRIAWETHALDRNKLGEVAISIRLERLLRKHYPSLATKIV
ncbi:MAG: hypothetical protein ACXADW_10880, partial [Candidatus Hodarchaeales archaeon]|jgi:hypothetical protein